MAIFLACVFVLCGSSGIAAQQPAHTLHIAAAADLQPVMPTLVAAYEHKTGTKLIVSFASSATLATQILNGEPADIFLAADFSFPEKVVAAGLADTKEPIAYATGALVLWARKDSPFQPLHLQALTDPRVKTVAIANQLHAPYGRAAVAALKNLRIYDKVSPHLVVAENIAQTAQFVESGNAQLGLISLTAASSPHFKAIGTFVRVPKVYPKIEQYGIVLKKSPERTEAHRFMTWLTSTDVQLKLPQLGLDPAS